MAEASDAGEYGVGRLGPDEGLRLGVGLVDVVLDGGLEIGGAGEHTALETAAGEEREPGLDQVEPGGRGGGEVQVPARAGRYTLLNGEPGMPSAATRAWAV